MSIILALVTEALLWILINKEGEYDNHREIGS